MTDRPPATAAPTPGPWRACKNGECRCGMVWSIPSDVPVTTVVGDKQHLIALVHDDFGDNAEMIYGSLGREAQKANARLIAAGPATAAERDRLVVVNAGLVEALENTANELENQLSLDPDMSSAASAYIDSEIALEKARAILAKARTPPTCAKASAGQPVGQSPEGVGG